MEERRGRRRWRRQATRPRTLSGTPISSSRTREGEASACGRKWVNLLMPRGNDLAKLSILRRCQRDNKEAVAKRAASYLIVASPQIQRAPGINSNMPPQLEQAPPYSSGPYRAPEGSRTKFAFGFVSDEDPLRNA